MSSERTTESIDRRQFIVQLVKRIGFIGLGVIAGSTALDASGRILPAQTPGMGDMEGDYAGV